MSNDDKIETAQGWQPIATVPLDRAVEVTELPPDGRAANISVVHGFGDLRNEASATHWRELTPQMRAAILRAMKETSLPAGTA